MVSRLNGRLPWLVACAAVCSLVLVSPALAQSTGMIRGVVKDAAGKPVEGAKVNIDADANNRHFDTKTDKKGEFLQIGLAPGPYKVTAEKDKVMAAAVPVTVRISAGNPITLVLGAGGTGVDPAAAAKGAALKKTFEEGVTASRAGNHDAAITAFQAAAEINPNCFDCYYNIAFSETQKKDYDKAEIAYKKAIELKADYGEAYSGLANVYNAQRKFDLAATASAKAMELSGSAPGALARRQCRRDVQPGRDPLERRQDRRSQEAVRGRRRRQPESRRIALSARHGAGERRQTSRGRDRVRDLSQARADRTERRDRQRHPGFAEEIGR